jgi:hypothetical protein
MMFKIELISEKSKTTSRKLTATDFTGGERYSSNS